ncbi:EAL domain-containing response regulator [Thioalkalivibrio sp. XN8]|uniref:EAL domain-containing response regulator n=1 Tax=Thioalkalivibrio sp. XN8 TaxID=2712863 RepID=UPI0013EDBF34|nr:EAL domain-containing response regulator [Thioalkalivibrio sp. XN8]NGP52607.1 EAL domain-containing protein [Thioalkalivibrio sp. XN8]
MTPEILIMEPDAELCGRLADYCSRRGYRTAAAADFASLAEQWHPELRFVTLSLSGNRGDGVDSVRFLSERACQAGLIMTGLAPVRVLNSASRLARARGLRLVGQLQHPFSEADFGALLMLPVTDEDEGTRALRLQLSHEMISDRLDRGRIQPWFQPKIDLETLRPVGMEALARLDDPERGTLPPATFIRVAEESGLIFALTEALVCHAFSAAARWRANGAPLQLAVNISPSLLSDERLPQTLVHWADTFRLKPSQITLEVTENWDGNSSVDTLETLTRLRLQGFELSIDDFGTGRSNMAQLNELPYSELKLDRCFVRNALVDDEAAAILQSNIRLGHELQMRVVAEGIDNLRVWNLVSDLGCDEGQGYFVARAMEGDKVLDWVRRWNTTRGTG